MVALRTYKPKELGFTPFQIASELAKPIDYNGTLSQLEEWNKLANSESVQAFNQAQAEEKQRDLDLQNAYDQEVQSKLEAGIEPLKIDQAEIFKTIGDTEKLLKISELRAKSAEEAPIKALDKQIKEARLAKLTAPPQKSGDGKVKEKKPQILVNPDTGEARVENAGEDGFIPLDLVKKAQDMGLDLKSQSESTPAPEPGPGIVDRTASFLSSLTGGQPTPMASPTASPTKGSLPPPPPGFEYTGKVNANGDLGIRRVR